MFTAVEVVEAGLVHIRAVRGGELVVLRDIERAAGECFRGIGMAEIADDEPLAVAELARYRAAGLAWAAVDETDTPVAYLIAGHVDGNLHIEQVSVHPKVARQGVGRSLLDHLARHGAAHAVPALTLTTFTHVPWNAPYYERCGFHRLDAGEAGPGLQRIRREEAACGYDRWPRICMSRSLRSVVL